MYNFRAEIQGTGSEKWEVRSSVVATRDYIDLDRAYIISGRNEAARCFVSLKFSCQPKSLLNLKCRFGITQGHSKWHQSIDRTSSYCSHCMYSHVLYRFRDKAKYWSKMDENRFLIPVRPLREPETHHCSFTAWTHRCKTLPPLYSNFL